MTTKLDMDGWTDKDSKVDECRELYEEHPFLRAYGLHSDLRVQRHGYRAAVGRADEWDSHGELQLAFLQERGLLPSSRLLDLGCGAGRLARRVVPFLDPGHYVGLDISGALVAQAELLSREEGWGERNPGFYCGDGTLDAVRARAPFDFVWAHSVFTHSPPEVIRAILADLAQTLFGVFFFTYKPAAAPRRSGLKQFQYPPSWFQGEAEAVGLVVEALEVRWPAKQRTMKVWRP